MTGSTNAEQSDSSRKKRPNRQGKPLRKRSKPVPLPTGRFRFSDLQWNNIVKDFKFPAEARKDLETHIMMYRNGLAEQRVSVPPSKTRQNLNHLSKAAQRFCDELQRGGDDTRAWDIIACLPRWPLERMDRLEEDLIELSEALLKAADSVQPTHPGVSTDRNLFSFVNALAELWEKYTGTRFSRAKKRKTPGHFIEIVGRIANPHLHLDTLRNVVRSVAEKRPWEN
jgi:hypothetical protein